MDKLKGFALPRHPTYLESSDTSELAEEDVWEYFGLSSINQGTGNSTACSNWAGSISGKSSREAHSVWFNSSFRTITCRSSNARSNGSLGYISVEGRSHMYGSAPVRVPDWPTFGRVYAARDEEDEEESEGKLPPHEIVARAHAKNQMTPFSVMEGAGRTLKGRDLNNVRNAVWRNTGFLD